MAKAPPPEPIDHHYNIGRLTRVFAASSVVAVVTFVGMVVHDNNRDWKSWQRAFKRQDREKTLEARAAAEARLDYTAQSQFEAKRAEGQKRISENRAELAKARRGVLAAEATWYAADQDFRFKKAEMDTARYLYETQKKESPKSRATASALRRYEGLTAAYEKSRTFEQDTRALWDKAKDEVGTYEKTVQEAEEGLKTLLADWDRFNLKLKTLKQDAFFQIRNFPFADMLAPNLKIEQVQLDGLFKDMQFLKTQKVDRCMTCHIAADKRGFEDPERYKDVVLRTHPRLDLFVDSNSPHPYSSFGCTSCHGGLDRATNFMYAGHMPRDYQEYETLEHHAHEGRDEAGNKIDKAEAKKALRKTQTARWMRKYDWKIDRFLETPMYPMQAVEAGCFRCHKNQAEHPKAPGLGKGVKLIENLGCWSCHKMRGFENVPKTGPNLTRVATKTTPEWTARWLSDPRAFRKSTRMPRFFYLENFADEKGKAQTDTMIAGITTYLFEKSERPSYPAVPAGDAANGKILYENLGCQGCHISDANADRHVMDTWRQFGPNLVGLGDKTNPEWLAAWLKNPKDYNHDTRMPNLRLSEDETRDLVAFLMQKKASPEFQSREVPKPDAKERDAFVREGLEQTMSVREADAKLAAMSAHEKDLYVGEKMILHYGCYACHSIKGFETAKPIGVELSEWGNKAVHLLDFGFIHAPHTRADWLAQKVREPRSFDRGKIKAFSEKSKMPKFTLSPEEVQAVQTAVLGMQKDDMAAQLMVRPVGPQGLVEAGRRLIKDRNCQGCHKLEGSGGQIRETFTDEALAPPIILGQGAKVQSDWLFGFLNAPKNGQIRPWLRARMPTFNFTTEELNSLTGYFASLDKAQYPFQQQVVTLDEKSRAAGAKTFEALRCYQCHPTSPEAFDEALRKGAKPADLAPILSAAHKRLRYDWIAEWIRRPEEMMPGTRMPTNFPKMDEKTGKRMSPLAPALDSPAFSGLKKDLIDIWGSEAEAKAYIGDPDRVTKALRDHVWSLGNEAVRPAASAATTRPSAKSRDGAKTASAVPLLRSTSAGPG